MPMAEGGNESYMHDKLYEAARWSTPDSATDIPSNGLSLLTPGDQSNVLHVAARHGNHIFISTLAVQHNMDFYKLLCKRNSKGETPLHLAAQSGCMKTVDVLLNNHNPGDQINNNLLGCWGERDKVGDTPLHIALRCGHEDVALSLFKRDLQLASLYNNVGESLAYLAAQNFCVKFLQKALDHDRNNRCSVSFSGPFGQTAFHPARNLTGQIMSILVERRRPLLKAQDNNGKTVLDYAVEENRGLVVKILLKADNTLAYLYDRDGLTPLHKAARKGLLPMVQTILELSPQSLTIRDNLHGQTALHVVKMDPCSLEECLTNTRMRELINEVDNDGNTPLHLALMNSDRAAVDKLLLVSGINWRLANKQGNTPMDLCTCDDQIPQKLKSLVAAGRVDTEMVNMKIFFNCGEVATTSDDHNTLDKRLSSRGPGGDTILHMAARNGNMEIINKVLMKSNSFRDYYLSEKNSRKSDSPRDLLLSGQNSNGETPLHLAAGYGQLKVVKFILSLTETLAEHGNPFNTLANDENPSNIPKNDENPSISLENDQNPSNTLANDENPSNIPKNDENPSNSLENDENPSNTPPNDENPSKTLANDENPSTIVDIGPNMEPVVDSVQVRPWRIKAANGDTPAHKALRNRHAKVALVLVRHDRELIRFINNQKESLLYLAAENRCCDVLEEILSEDSSYDDLITTGRGGRNFFHAISGKNARSTNLVWHYEKLIEKQRHLLEKVDDNGKTPLHLAVEEFNTGTANWLLRKNKSAAFVYDNEGFTPLLRAAAEGRRECMYRILDVCPQSADLRDLSNNRTALHLLKLPRGFLRTCTRNEKIRKLINETDKDGNTALHCAILDGDIDKALVLLEAPGINWLIKNKQDQSPEGLCRQMIRSGNTDLRSVQVALLSLGLGDEIMPRCPRMVASLINYLLMSYTELVLTEANLKKLLDNMAVAAALLVTITFAAAFTVPGGYDQNTGEAMRIKQAAIKVFMASDILAMLMAISILVWYTIGSRRANLKKVAMDSIIMLQISLAATVIAFISGVYAIGWHVKPVFIVPLAISALFNLFFLFSGEWAMNYS